ncbi:MAG: hypothetical protein RL641_795 [Candidatus Parcubacteria bacterium]|jgi:hypothetical protein
MKNPVRNLSLLYVLGYALFLFLLAVCSSCTDHKIIIVDANGIEYTATAAPIAYNDLPDTGEYVPIMKASPDFGQGFVYSGRDAWSYSDSSRVFGLQKYKIVKGKVIAIKK